MLYAVAVICRAGDGVATRYWRNTHEVDAGALATWDAAKAQTIAGHFETAAAKTLLNVFYVDRVVVGAYSEETIISEDQFVVKMSGILGARVPGANNMLGIESTLVARKQTVSGRNGATWLRGFLHEGDVLGTTGGSVYLSDLAGINTLLSDQYNVLAAALLAVTCKMVLARGVEPLAVIREVTGVSALGVRSRQVRRRVRRGPALPGPLQTVIDGLRAVASAPGMVNPILTAYNLLPLADVPLLPE